MAKIYAKNPANPVNTPAEFVIDNPQQTKKRGTKMAKRKNPKRVAAGKKAARTRQQRKNPVKGIAKTGKNMFLTSFVAVGGGFGLAKLLQLGMDRFGDKLPAKVVEFTPIVAPIGIGAVTGFFGKGNHLLQSAATGMMISGISSGFEKFLPAENQANLSGARMLSDGELILGNDGNVRTPEGVIVAKAKLDDNNEEKERFLGGPLLEDFDDQLFLGEASDKQNDVTFSDKEDLFVA